MSKSVKKLSVLVLAFFAFVALSLAAFAFQAKADADLITIASAAEVRLDDAEKTPDEDDTGIRFVITAQKAAIEAEYEGYDVSYGAVLIPTALLGGEELDAAVKSYGGNNVLDIPAVNTIGDEEVVKFAAVLKSIPDSFYNTEISARGYAKLTKGEEVVYVQTEDVVSRSFGYVVAKKIAEGNATAEEKVILDGYMNDYILPAVTNELHGAELASFDNGVYETLFSYGRGSAADYSIEYLDQFSGKTGVVKISGTAANNLVLHLTLPKAMTPTGTGPQSSGSSNIKVKDEAGNPTEEDRIFDLTSIAADIYIANAGTSAFGFWQSIYDGNADAGWGGKNFAPTLDAWKTYTLNLITSDTLRFGVAAGDFEFYVAGIYQGTELDVNKTLISETLGENELANFDSDEYLKLITNDPVYGGRPGTNEIGTFKGKDNVLKITKYGDVYKAPIYLPKNPTGNAITIQFYLEGGSGFRFGLLGINNPGWMDPNHSTTYATDKWVTVVYTGFSNFASATYPMLRFNTDSGTSPDAIYIAGIWDGDQKAAIEAADRAEELKAIKAELANELVGTELASFDDAKYVDLFNNSRGSAASYKVEYLESYLGKNGVIKVSGTSASSFVLTLTLPKAMPVTKTGTQTSGGAIIKDENGGNRIFDLTDLVVDMYVVSGGDNVFGFWQSIYDGNVDPGWAGKNFTPTLDAWTDYINDFITADTLRFGVNAGDFEFYIAGIYQGSKREASQTRLAETLGEKELANFDSDDYLNLITNDPVYGGRPNTSEIGTFHGQDNVLKFSKYTTSRAICPIYLPKNPTGDKITIQFYLEGGSGYRFGLFGIKQGNEGWMNPNHSADYATGEWVTVVYTGFTGMADQKYPMLRFVADGGTAPDAIYIAGIWDGDQRAAALAGSLGENELANFDSKDYATIVTGATAEVGAFQGKENVIKLTVNSTYSKIALPKAMTAGEDGKSTVTIEVYLETDGIGYGSFGVHHGGWVDPWGGDAQNAAMVGKWSTRTITLTACDYIQFYMSPALAGVTLYISVIVEGTIA